MPMKPYVIKQGDYLLKLSHTLGFNHDKVWSDGKNAKMRGHRFSSVSQKMCRVTLIIPALITNHSTSETLNDSSG